MVPSADQKSRGDALVCEPKGEEFSVYGDDSRETIIFCGEQTVSTRYRGRRDAIDHVHVPTFVAWL